MMDTVNSYFNIYLDEVGFTKTMIGTVTGVAYLAAMGCQPVFGVMLDRCASRTRVLQGLILITAILYPLILLNTGFVYVLLLYTAFTIFRRLQPAVNTALSVEFAEESGRDYGPIRMMGAVGYTAMMTLVSFIAGGEGGVKNTFWFYSIICAGNILLLFLLPPMPGHNRKREENGVSVLALIKNRGVVLLLVFHVLISTANGIGFTYFPIYAASEMGAGNALYGVMVTVGSLLEIPFLFLADRIIRRLGAKWTVVLLGLLAALRWGNAYFAQSTGQLFITQGMNFVNILEGVVVAILVNRLVLPQVKTAAQTLIATIQSVVGILISSFAGGLAADLIGIRPLFLFASALALGTAVLFFFLLRNPERLNGKEAIQ